MNVPKTVLVAEDDASDAFLLQRAFETAGLSCSLLRVTDGQEALDYLSGAKGYSDRQKYPLPDLLLLDLKMPRMGGFEVLHWLQRSREFSLLPTVVLSSSGLDEDRAKAHKLGSRAYYVKPTAFSDLVSLVLEMNAKWLGLPTTEPLETGLAGR